MDNTPQSFSILSWNIRGLNSGARQESLKQVISIYRPELVCIQETKMEVINSRIVRNAPGSEFEDNYLYLPASGTSGVILLAARGAYLKLQNPILTVHTISTPVIDTRVNAMWMVTRVYRP
jgi:exonuclease III